MERQKEWLLLALMLLTIAVSVFAAWMSVPELTPPAVELPAAGSIVTTVPPPTVTTKLSVSLNNGTLQELMQISGIGEKTAQNIVNYRETHGGFHSVEELLNLPGVGEKRLAEWAPYLTL